MSYSDSFNGAGSATDLASWPSAGDPDWAYVVGSTGLTVQTGGSCKGTAAGEMIAKVIDAVGAAITGDQKVTCTGFDVSDGNAWQRVCARINGTPNFYMVELPASGAIDLYRYDGGSYTLLAASSKSLSGSYTVYLQAVTNGSQEDLECQAGATGAVTYSDTSGSRISSGVGGLGCYGSEGATDGIDSILIESIGGGTNYTRTLSDSISVTDAPIRSVKLSRVALEAISVAELISESVLRGRTIQEPSVSVLDSLRDNTLRFRLIQEAFSLSDNTERYVQALRILSEQVDLFDAISSTVGGAVSVIVRTLTDSIAVGDSTTRLFKHLRVLTEGIDLSEEIRRQVLATRQTADAVTVQEAIARGQTVGRSLVDTLVVSDALARAAILTRATVDATTAADFVIRRFTLQRLLSDALEVNDALIVSIVYGYLSQALGKFLLDSEVQPIATTAEKAQDIKLDSAPTDIKGGSE